MRSISSVFRAVFSRPGGFTASCILLLCVALTPASMAQTGELVSELQASTQTVSDLTREFANGDSDLEQLKEAFIDERAELTRLKAAITEEREGVQETLNRLGDAVEGEAASVSAQREAVQQQLARLDEAIATADQNLAQVNRLEDEIDQVRRKAFYDDLTERSAMLVDFGTWGRGAGALALNWGQLREETSEWQSSDAAGRLSLQTFLILLGALVAALIIAIPIRRWLVARLVEPLGRAGYETRLSVLVALIQVGLRSLPLNIAVVLVSNTIAFMKITPPSLDIVLQASFVALSCLIVVTSACIVFMSARRPVAPFRFQEPRQAFLLCSLFVTTASIIAVDHVLRVQLEVYGSSPDLNVLLKGVVSVLLAGVLLLMMRIWTKVPSGAPDANVGEPGTSHRSPLVLPRFLRTLIGLASIAAAFGALLGYADLSHFVLTRIILLGGLTLSMLVLKAALMQVVLAAMDHFTARHAREDGDEDLMEFWVSILMHVLVSMLWIPIALLLLGFEWESVRRILLEAITGITIGPVRISLLQIAIAIAVFLGVILGTRIVQRTAQTRVLNRLRVDVGVQSSLKTLIGYVGLVIAFFTGVSLLGFDLSNLAIIAGALSVGIGFGLQSIVNNFVSGLILLFERPIKAGDWVVTSSGEGIVKKISVRSTEIETFERSSILIPNSELISNSVTNLTHKNHLARVAIPVGVSYNEDPDEIIEILKTVPDEIDEALSDPQPMVLFTGFGDSSLDFELRIYIADVGTSLTVRTKARVAIFKAFKDAGVEIPFPQRDLHVRSVQAEFPVQNGKFQQLNSETSTDEEWESKT